MKDPKHRAELATLLEHRRRELGERTDISQAMRKLSQSSSRNPIGPQPKPRSATVGILLGVAAVVVLVACIVSAVSLTAGALALNDQLTDPSTTVQRFYSALHQQDYGLAYSYFSKNLKKNVSQSTFTDQYSSYDKVKGVIQSYPVQSSTVGAATATMTIAVVRRSNDSTAQLQTLRLIKESNDWHIDGINIGGAVPIPSPTA
ncbi:MAG TPA: hypothetical protein VF510_20140 [Ktedonobacterales bacterium]